MSETLKAKMARISARIQQRSGNARARLAKHPHLLEFCEQARARFGARLTYLQDDDGEMGTRPADFLQDRETWP